jgi:hypothetical protein
MSLHRAGGKITRSHTPLIDAAIPVVDNAEKYSEVSKISLGEIKVIGRGLPNIKFFPINGGWKLVIRGNISRQDIFIYTDDPEKTRKSIELL